MKAISDLTEQEVALVLARHEYTSRKVELNEWVSIDGVTPYEINWQTIGPLWEREYFILFEKIFDKTHKLWESEDIAFSTAARYCFVTSKSPLSIARALLIMWYPDGVKI